MCEGGSKNNWVNLVVAMQFIDVSLARLEIVHTVNDDRHKGMVPIVSSGYSIRDFGATFCGWGFFG